MLRREDTLIIDHILNLKVNINMYILDRRNEEEIELMNIIRRKIINIKGG